MTNEHEHKFDFFFCFVAAESSIKNCSSVNGIGVAGSKVSESKLLQVVLVSPQVKLYICLCLCIALVSYGTLMIS